MDTTITPSLPAQSFREITMLTDALAGVVPMLQVDIVDGVFAPINHGHLQKVILVPRSLYCRRSPHISHLRLIVWCENQNSILKHYSR